MSIIVPPGGFAGLAQMTPAGKAQWSVRGKRAATRRRRPKAIKRRAKSARRAKRRLKFGSPAWRKKYLKK